MGEVRRDKLILFHPQARLVSWRTLQIAHDFIDRLVAFKLIKQQGLGHPVCSTECLGVT